jgi:UDP-N-acetylmuramate--alanine ligase
MLMNGIPTSPYVEFTIGDWRFHSESILIQIAQQLTFPVFVKPVHLGSSVGVKKVDRFEDLLPVIENTFLLDDHLLVENGLKMREIEFSLLGNDWVTAFPPGEILASGKVYDYNSKYADDGFQTMYKADLPEYLIREGCEIASLSYKAAGCIGMARVDTFLDENNKFWLNEINPIPGFTGISLYPKMCEVNGLSKQGLADRLIVLALQHWRQKGRMDHYEKVSKSGR